jgi:HPt (histidine-containing phosphotransfer) domain-containing protein
VKIIREPLYWIAMKQTINNDKIQELIELDGDGEVLKELINLFVLGTESKLNKLSGMSAQPEIKLLAHEMRSSSANLGAEILSDLATQLEYLPVDENYQQNVKGIVQKMNAEFLEVKKILESHL